MENILYLLKTENIKSFKFSSVFEELQKIKYDKYFLYRYENRNRYLYVFYNNKVYTICREDKHSNYSTNFSIFRGYIKIWHKSKKAKINLCLTKFLDIIEEK